MIKPSTILQFKDMPSTVTAAVNKPKVSLIVAALLPQLGIGYKGTLPWSLKQEMAYFRKVTTSTVDPNKKNVVIMGRKTYESIPAKFRPLKGRINFILTRDVNRTKDEFAKELEAHPQTLKISQSLDDVIKSSSVEQQVEEIFIIGGAEIYNQLLTGHHGNIDRILLTEVSQASGQNLEMDAFIKLDNALWQKDEDSELFQYLTSKNLHEEFNLLGNQEKEFQYDFTLWKKRI